MQSINSTYYSYSYFILLLCLFKITKSESLINISPCAYPPVADTTNCGILPMFGSMGLICDPEHIFSHTELTVLNEKIEKIYNSKGDNCICNNSIKYPCWYKFGFAFLRQLTPVEGGIKDEYNRDYCPINKTLLHIVNKKRNDYLFSSPESVQIYGERFAEIIRDRWSASYCGEEILFFILKNRPIQLIEEGYENIIPGKNIPMIFVALGPTVIERLDMSNPKKENSLFFYHSAVIKETLIMENAKLLNGYPLLSVIESSLDKFVTILSNADNHLSSSKVGNHIPSWALIVFGVCALSCCLMAIGLCFVRTSARRSSQRGKPNADPNRRWKAGFVGEDSLYHVNYGGSSGDNSRANASGMFGINLVQIPYQRAAHANV
uniref:Receptor ligand binding region domain-containing protein n=1 Tax=Strongyloides venezuelensis TaxID=75913 RepID=A0A0K0F6R3_STRVS